MLRVPPLPSLLLNSRGRPNSPFGDPIPREGGAEVLVGTRAKVEVTGGKAEEEGVSDSLLPLETPLPLVTTSQLSPCPAPILDPLLQPIGGRLSRFWQEWVKIGAEPWVVRTLREGYKIPFVTLPPLTLAWPLGGPSPWISSR